MFIHKYHFKMSTIQFHFAYFCLHVCKVKTIVREKVSQVEMQLKSGFASSVSAQSKKLPDSCTHKET